MCNNRFRFGIATVVLLVILRLSLGCHFFYEGVWKITHPEFSAEGYLRQAKGPLAGLFYAMVPDIDGRTRLKIERIVNPQKLRDRWQKVRDDAERSQKYATHKQAAQELLRKYLDESGVTLKREGVSTRSEILDAIGEFRKDVDRRFKSLDDGEVATIVMLNDYEAKLASLLADEDQAKATKLIDDWKKVRRQVLEQFNLIDQRRAASQAILYEHADKLETYLTDNGDAIVAYFMRPKQDDQPAEGLPENLKTWLTDIGAIEQEYFAALGALLAADLGGEKPTFPAIVPDAKKGLRREQVVSGRRIRDLKGNELVRIEEGVSGAQYVDAWNRLRDAVIERYQLDDQQKTEAHRICRRYKDSLRSFLTENRAEIAGYFGALERLRHQRAVGNTGAAHQKERLYNEQVKLRAEVGGWLYELQECEDGYRNALWAILTDEQRQEGTLPERWDRMDLINLAVTWGLTAIGLCLLLGLFTRPAALGGACFMFFVILTQPNWPTVFPPATPAEGHALLIDKNFIEMIALLLVVTTGVGRWGGLDCFVENYVVGLYHSLRGRKKEKKEGA